MASLEKKLPKSLEFSILLKNKEMRTRQLTFLSDNYVPSAYFMLLSPPEPFRSRMLEEQGVVDKILGKGKINVSIPHISLPWFRWERDDEESAVSKLVLPTKEFPTFKIHVCGFDRFGTHTIFWNIEDFGMVQTLSDTCCTNLFGNRGPTIKRPHITLIRQLKPDQSIALWQEEYENRSKRLEDRDVFKFDVSNLTLVRAEIDVEATKRKGGLIRTSKWEIVKRFPLNEKNQ